VSPAADHLFELALSKEELLARATEIEGHPDNVAAAIYGGFVVCAAGGAPTLVTPGVTSVEGEGGVAARFDPPEGLRGAARTPPRGALDPARPRRDPGRSAARRRRRQHLRRGPAGPRTAERR